MYKFFKSNERGIANITLLIGLGLVLIFGALAYKAAEQEPELYSGFIFNAPKCECSGGNDCGECSGECYGGCSAIFGVEYECGGSSGNYACEIACDGDCGGTCHGSCPSLGGFEQTCKSTGVGVYFCDPIEDIVEEVTEDIEEAVETGQSELEKARDELLEIADEFCNSSPQAMAVCDAIDDAGDAIASAAEADPEEWCDSHEDRESTCDNPAGRVVAMWCALNDVNWEICVAIEQGTREMLPEALSELGWGIETTEEAIAALNSGWCSLSPETRNLCDVTAQVGAEAGRQMIQETLGLSVDTTAPYVPNCPEPGKPSNPDAIGIKLKRLPNNTARNINTINTTSTFQIHFIDNATSQEIDGSFNIQECLTLDSHGKGTISNIEAKPGYVEFTYDCGFAEGASRQISAEYKVAGGGAFAESDKDNFHLTCTVLPGRLGSQKFRAESKDFLELIRPELREKIQILPELNPEIFGPLIQEHIRTFERKLQTIRGIEDIKLWNPQLELRGGLKSPQLQQETIQIEGGQISPQLEKNTIQIDGTQMLEGAPIETETIQIDRSFR